MIKPAYSVSFLLSINIVVWQNVLYFLDAPRILVRLMLVMQINITVCCTEQLKCLEQRLAVVNTVMNLLFP